MPHILDVLQSRIDQCFSTFVRPRPGKFFFHKTRTRSQQIYSSAPSQFFLSSHKHCYRRCFVRIRCLSLQSNLVFQYLKGVEGEGRGLYRVLVGKPEGKRTLGRPRRRWEDNIKMDIKKVGGRFMDWIELDQDRDRWRAFVIAVMNCRVP